MDARWDLMHDIEAIVLVRGEWDHCASVEHTAKTRYLPIPHMRLESLSLQWYSYFCMLKSNFLSVAVSGQIGFGDRTRIAVTTGARPLAKGERDD